jgi:hypothetical protein
MFKEYFTIFYQIAVMILLILICIKIYIYNSQEKYEEEVNCSDVNNEEEYGNKGCTWTGESCVRM